MLKQNFCFHERERMQQPKLSMIVTYLRNINPCIKPSFDINREKHTNVILYIVYQYRRYDSLQCFQTCDYTTYTVYKVSSLDTTSIHVCYLFTLVYFNQHLFMLTHAADLPHLLY